MNQSPEPTALARLVDQIRSATAAGEALCLRGGGTKDFYGQPPQGRVLDTSDYRGIVAYEPTELVITARCGTPLVELEAALSENGQWLPFEPPVFGEGATVGGMVAAGLSGPGRQSAGAVRDFVLGTAMIDGHGRALNFGGQVMKNVAGYDVSRLLCGSLGILGLIAEVSLKVLPMPAAETTLFMTMDQTEALRRLQEWGGQPLPVSASAWHDGGLRLRLSGARAAVEAAQVRFVREQGAVEIEPSVAAAYWAGLRDQSAAWFEGEAPLWRLSVPSTTPPIPLPGAPLLEWGGAQRWLRGPLDAAAVRAAAREAGGHATLFRGGDRSVGVFQPLAPAVAVIHRRLKQAFDPAGIFNPGRMYPDL